LVTLVGFANTRADTMPSYYRLMLGQRSVYAPACFAESYIGADFGIPMDLTQQLPEDWRSFNGTFIPIFLTNHPDKTRIGAGLACGALWTVCRGIAIGDIVLCPDGTGIYRLGEVSGGYMYAPGTTLPHRRPVRWLPQTINRADMSVALRNSTGSIGTVSNVTGYRDEIERLIGAIAPDPTLPDGVVEDPVAFAFEKHLEDFLVHNWAQTELGREYDIYEDDGEKVGQQYLTDTGPMDILAIKKDKTGLLVVELKRGRASDVVVGQTLRYMGYAMQELAEEGQTVRGAIIAIDDDPRLRRALAAVPSIRFYRYRVDFHLVPA
jgi:restriction system protein